MSRKQQQQQQGQQQQQHEREQDYEPEQQGPEQQGPEQQGPEPEPEPEPGRVGHSGSGRRGVVAHHGDESDELEQVVLHHIADQTDLIEVPRTPLNRDVLLQHTHTTPNVRTVQTLLRRTCGWS